MKISERLLPWQVLLSLSEGKGFALAADRFGRDDAFYCRLIHNLENEIGIKLTEPHSRPIRLSVEARELLPEARDFLEASERLNKKISQSGNRQLYVRLGIPINVPRAGFVEVIQAYQQKDPNLQVEILSEIDHEDVLSGKVDIAYLPYRPSPEGLFIWDVNKVDNVPLATPEYIRRYGNPQNPKDLANHNLILRTGRNYPVTKQLYKNGQKQTLTFHKIAFAGDVLTGKEWLMAGAGIAIDLSLAFCWEDIKQGKLVPVLNGWKRCPWDLTMVVKRQDLSNRRLIALARALVEHETKSSQTRARFYKNELKKLKESATSFI